MGPAARPRRIITLAASAALVLAVVGAPGSAAPTASPLVIADSISMDCTGWSITGVPFDDDPDGDGSASVGITVWDGSLSAVTATGATLVDETFTFPVGTVHDIGGTFAATPTVNPLVMLVDAPVFGTTYVGACDGNVWRAPAGLVLHPVVAGDTHLRVALQGSCYGTTFAGILRDEGGEVVDQWALPNLNRVVPDDQIDLPLAAPLPAGGYVLDEVCGTFDDPVSDPFSTTFATGQMTPTTVESAPPAAPTSGAATFTG